MAAATLTMAQALNRALRDAMAADERVLVFGEDVGTLGGVFRVTDGLAARLRRAALLRHPAGRGRHRRASRSAWRWTGSGRWSRCSSTRSPTRRSSRSPRHVAKMRNRTRGAVSPADRHPHPVRRRHRRRRAPLRLQRGLLRAHPGPEGRHPGDGRGRLLAAARGDRRPRPGDLPRAEAALLVARRRSTCRSSAAPFGTRRGAARRAATPRSSPTARRVPVALEAAEAAQDEGWDLEVVDLRTHRAVRRRDRRGVGARDRPGVVSTRPQGFAGVGAEIAARVQERCFHALHAPVLRVTGLRHPVPAAEARALPPAGRRPGPRRRRPAAVGRRAGPALRRR